jgi:hypothetical protein
MVIRGHTKEAVGLLNVNSIHLNTFFDVRSCPYEKIRGVVKCKFYTFKDPLRCYVVVITKKPWGC